MTYAIATLNPISAALAIFNRAPASQSGRALLPTELEILKLVRTRITQIEISLDRWDIDFIQHAIDSAVTAAIEPIAAMPGLSPRIARRLDDALFALADVASIGDTLDAGDVDIEDALNETLGHVIAAITESAAL